MIIIEVMMSVINALLATIKLIALAHKKTYKN